LAQGPGGIRAVALRILVGMARYLGIRRSARRFGGRVGISRRGRASGRPTSQRANSATEGELRLHFAFALRNLPAQAISASCSSTVGCQANKATPKLSPVEADSISSHGQLKFGAQKHVWSPLLTPTLVHLLRFCRQETAIAKAIVGLWAAARSRSIGTLAWPFQVLSAFLSIRFPFSVLESYIGA
jgi:hypothetical protein